MTFDLQLIPGDVVDVAGFLIDEVMVFLGRGIKHHRPLAERLHADQSLLNQEVQRVVDGRSRNSRAFFPRQTQDIVGGRVRFTLEHTLDHGHSLRRGLNPALSQNRDGVFHRIRLRRELDIVKMKCIRSEIPGYVT